MCSFPYVLGFRNNKAGGLLRQTKLPPSRHRGKDITTRFDAKQKDK